MQSVLVDEEGITPGYFPPSNTGSNDGEPHHALYANEEEKELYTFLSDNKLLMLYDKLKLFALYMEQLQAINIDHEEFDALCSENCLQLTDKPHLKIRFKAAIQSLNIRARIAVPDMSPNIAPEAADMHIQPHFYPPPGENIAAQAALLDNGPGAAVVPPKHMYPSPVPGFNPHNERNKVVNYLHDIEEKEDKPFVNSAYRIMVFIRIILWMMDHFVIQPGIDNKSIFIGGPFGSFLLFVMSISGMYNICKNPLSKKSGSLSVLLATTEIFYFATRDALSAVCFEELYHKSLHNRTMLWYNFGIHAMLSLLLGCCLGQILWQYRSEIFVQIHSSKLNAICNYLIFGWVFKWELDSVNSLVFGSDDMHMLISPKLEKIHNTLNLFLCTETSILLGMIFMAPPIKPS